MTADSAPPVNPPPNPALPGKPRLVLRIGFAGTQTIEPQEETGCGPLLDAILGATESALSDLRDPHGLAPESLSWKRMAYYSPESALIRVTTGLCEGADALMTQVVVDRKAKAIETAKPSVILDLAAIIPWDLATYKASRPPQFQPRFDDLATQCSTVIQLDGVYSKPDPDTETAKRARNRGYRAQAAFLMRQCDIYIALIDVAAAKANPGRAGGTLESIQRALALDLPVLLVDSKTQAIRTLEPGSDADEALYAEPNNEWTARLRVWVREIVTGESEHDHAETNTHLAHHSPPSLLQEFFHGPRNPAETFQSSFFRRYWNAFKHYWNVEMKNDGTAWHAAAHQAELPERLRARSLNSHYAGMYRGVFIFTYLLAMVAVGLAVFGLALKVPVPSDHDSSSGGHATPKLAEAHPEARIGHDAVPVESQNHTDSKGHAETNATNDTGSSHPAPHSKAFGLTLTAFKLGIVIAIFAITFWANKKHWSFRAVAYRFVAERLRTLLLLKSVGCLRMPTVSGERIRNRLLHQSEAEWLVNAFSRTLWLDHSNDERTITLKAEPLIETLQTEWIKG